MTSTGVIVGIVAGCLLVTGLVVWVVVSMTRPTPPASTPNTASTKYSSVDASGNKWYVTSGTAQSNITSIIVTVATPGARTATHNPCDSTECKKWATSPYIQEGDGLHTVTVKFYARSTLVTTINADFTP